MFSFFFWYLIITACKGNAISINAQYLKTMILVNALLKVKTADINE